MSKGSSESVRAQACVTTGGSGYEALDGSPRPEVLTLLARGRRIELWGREAITPCVVVGLLRWRITTHPSKRVSLPRSATLQRGGKGPSGPCHMEMEKWASSLCSRRVLNRRGTEEWDARGACKQMVEPEQRHGVTLTIWEGFRIPCEIFVRVCEMPWWIFFFRVFLLPRIFKDMPNYFEVPTKIDHQKPKLNQTKMKLKQEIKIKTSNNTRKISNKK